MRILHTSDWHIGVARYGVDRRQDHERAFSHLRDLAKDEKVDAILNTGDLFDALDPALDVLQYGWSVLEEMAQIAPVVVLCGNHDRDKLFELFRTVLHGRLPIYFVDPSFLRNGADSIIKIKSADDEIIKIGAVPFIKSAQFVKRHLSGEDPERVTLTYAEEVATIEKAVGTWLNDGYDAKRDVRVFAAHLLLDGAQLSGSERQMHIEEDFATRATAIPIADYVAFGHIHKPQEIAGGHGRYAGSPIPIDFGERNDKKSAVIIHGRPGRALSIKEHEIDFGRRLAYVDETIDGLCEAAGTYDDAIVKVTVRLDAATPDLDARVRSLLPNTIVCAVVPKYSGELVSAVTVQADEPEEQSVPQMFSTFLAERENLADASRVSRFFTAIYDQVVNEGDHLTFEGLSSESRS